ncbi:MAG: uroporphyrinogen-III synthase [Gemmatimonadetes bacterium]|nr:uroporphyrinogen-III synthase [Gemmatimonadota bacterium]
MSPDVLPLAGLRVAVTRPRDDTAELRDLLASAGAEPVVIPLTRVTPSGDDAPLTTALAELDRYDWIVFTSPRAVRAVAALVTEWPGERLRIAVVGPATAAAARALIGRDADCVSATPGGAGVVPAMREYGILRDRHVLWPRAESSRPDVARDLAREGAIFDDPIAYRTVTDAAAGRRLAGMVAAGDVDVVTFTAPSAVDCFADSAGHAGRCTIAVIGPTTAAAVRARGLPVDVESPQPAMTALVDALVQYREGTFRAWIWRP